MEATAESLRWYFGGQKIIFIVGVMADKDVDSMMSHIVSLAETLIAVKPNNARAMCSRELTKSLAMYGVPAIDCGTVSSGVSKALEIVGERDIICALGSLYFSAEVRTAYKNICHVGRPPFFLEV